MTREEEVSPTPGPWEPNEYGDLTAAGEDVVKVGHGQFGEPVLEIPRVDDRILLRFASVLHECARSWEKCHLMRSIASYEGDVSPRVLKNIDLEIEFAESNLRAVLRRMREARGEHEE